jgi:diacylglycerol O-acyltransferase / wax synthase
MTSAVRGPGRAALRLPVALWDVVAGLAVFALYLAVAATTATRLGMASANAETLNLLERGFGLPSERAVNHWTAGHRILSTLADYHYAIGYLATTAATLLWIRFRRRSLYPRVATTFLITTVLAIAVFLLYPVTPPRLLSDGGFIDTVSRHGTVGSWGSGLVTSFANEHAAMPSLHVAWAVWMTIALIVAGAPRWVCRLAVFQVFTTTAVIVMTGNHWILDAFAGAVLALTVEGVWRTCWSPSP